jgi:hypothetical protein
MFWPGIASTAHGQGKRFNPVTLDAPQANRHKAKESE